MPDGCGGMMFAWATPARAAERACQNVPLKFEVPLTLLLFGISSCHDFDCDSHPGRRRRLCGLESRDRHEDAGRFRRGRAGEFERAHGALSRRVSFDFGWQRTADNLRGCGCLSRNDAVGVRVEATPRRWEV